VRRPDTPPSGRTCSMPLPSFMPRPDQADVRVGIAEPDHQGLQTKVGLDDVETSDLDRTIAGRWLRRWVRRRRRVLDSAMPSAKGWWTQMDYLSADRQSRPQGIRLARLR
jgi:hypothetical protein